MATLTDLKVNEFIINLNEPLRGSACGARPAALWGKFRLRLALTGKPKPLLGVYGRASSTIMGEHGSAGAVLWGSTPNEETHQT